MKKRILQISAYYPPHLGGQEYAVQSLARKLVQNGRDVQVIASANGAKQGRTMEDGVRVARLAGKAIGHAPIMPGLPLTLMREMKRNTVTHLHIGQAFTPEAVWAVAALKRRPYIAQLHIDFAPSGPLGALLPLYKKLILKRVLHRAAAVIVLNKAARQLVRQTYNYAGPLHIINNGIDDDYYTLERRAQPYHTTRPLALLFVGRLTKQKNIGALLQALAKMPHNFTLDVVGEGDERPAAEQLMRQLGLQGVTFHGRLPRAQILGLYATRDALVMPSLYEAQPLVLLEAMAARIPIIGTDVVGVAEHLRGNGIVVPPTVQGIFDGISQFVSHQKNVARLTQHGYQQAQHYHWDQVLPQYEALYETITH